jgi:hypothetical protein
VVGRWGLGLLIKINANVIESRKASAIDVLYAMVRDKESFLPAHKNSPAVIIRHGKVWSLQVVLNVSECREALPMDHVLLFRGTPVACQKAVTAANDFGIKVSRKFWPVLRKTTYPQVATQK